VFDSQPRDFEQLHRRLEIGADDTAAAFFSEIYRPADEALH